MSDTWQPPTSRLEAGFNGLTLSDVTDETKAIMCQLDVDRAKLKPVVMPIYNASAYKIDSVDEYLKIIKTDHLAKTGYIYSRLGSPTVEEVECVVKALEGAAGTLAFPSGMSAYTTAMLAVLKSGDHVIAHNPIYAGLHKFLTTNCPNLNIEYTWVPAGCDIEEYRKKIKPNTRLLIAETPCNPVNSILDLEAFGKLGLSSGGKIITMVDATYSSPYLMKPCTMGVDIVVHSATKYLSGHSDMLGGVVSTRTVDLYHQINLLRTTLGSNLSPFDAFLLSRGIKTLHVRMDRHCENAEKVVNFLNNHPKVATVYYPGLKSHPNHEVAARQMKKFGGMVSFEMKGGLDAAKTLVESVRIIHLAVSLGGVESLIQHPASMTHGPLIMSDAERAQGLITDGLVRLSVGIENGDDLVKDLSQALDKVKPL